MHRVFPRFAGPSTSSESVPSSVTPSVSEIAGPSTSPESVPPSVDRRFICGRVSQRRKKSMRMRNVVTPFALNSCLLHQRRVYIERGLNRGAATELQKQRASHNQNINTAYGTMLLQLCCPSTKDCHRSRFFSVAWERRRKMHQSFHSILWSLMPKEQHSSLIAVETALHEAVLRYNAGCCKATEVISDSIGLQPGHLAIQRPREKDALRLKKNSKRHQEKMEARQKNKRVRKDTSNYSTGAF